MGKKCKKKVQWRQLSLNELPQESSTLEGEECEEDEGEAAAHTPPHHYGNPHPFSPYSRPPYHPYPPHFPRRGGAPHHGYRHFDKRFDKNFDRHGGFDRYPNENLRNFENRGPYGKPPFYERHYYYDKYYGRPPFCADPNFKFGYVERGRRPFRPYGRHGFFHRGFSGYLSDGGHPKDLNGYAGQEEEEEEDWEEIRALEQSGMEGGERPSQPVHTVMINNEEYTKIQTPRQEVIFKKSSLDRKQDSLDQASVTGSMTSSSGSCSTSGCRGGDRTPGSPGGSGDQLSGDQVSLSGSMEDNTLSVGGDEPSDTLHRDAVFEDPGDMFVSEGGGPPLAGVVMQQAYPGGPMFTIPVHWTPFIDPALIPGETALTPLDPAFTHVIDPKSLPIDPVHILPVQHDATGCPVQVQVKVDSNGVPIQIEPSAFTVTLGCPQHAHAEAKDHTDTLPRQGHTHAEHTHRHQENIMEKPASEDAQEGNKNERVGQQSEGVRIENNGEVGESQSTACVIPVKEKKEYSEVDEDTKQQLQQDGGAGIQQQLEEGKGGTGTHYQHMQKQEGEASAATLHQLNTASISAGDVCSMSSPACEGGEAGGPRAQVTGATEHLLGKVQGAVMATTHQTHSVVLERAMKNKSVKGSRVLANVVSLSVGAGELQAKPLEDDEDEEEEEEEEEEDMLTKESEEGSDSNDSQYASMSESSTTPTTPEGEPSDAHEISPPMVTPTAASSVPMIMPTTSSSAPMITPSLSSAPMITPTSVSVTQSPVNTKVGSSTSPQTAASSDSLKSNGCTDYRLKDSQETSSEAMVTQETSSEAKDIQEKDSLLSESQEKECPAVESQEGDSNVQANVLQGYVMVPILTPYYDPSVLYGYPVVVASQQQQLHQQPPTPPPPPQQHGYSKRKKKKYQRRRHADVSAGGSYLDPQLYTGEPFVATPGGYVVPIEAAASVCQIHGLQYVTPAFHQHLPDEGFVSVQHSPYLPEVATEPIPAEVQSSEGTNQDDASKTVFSDLQDTERRQIQEILQENAKAGKSDSTEFSDSGVSESEEIAAPELSCDEVEACKQQTPQISKLAVNDSAEENTLDLNSTTLPCQEVSSSGLERIGPEAVSQEGFSEKTFVDSNVQLQEDSTGELHCAQPQVTDGNPFTVDSSDNGRESSSKTGNQDLLCIETPDLFDGSNTYQSSVKSDETDIFQVCQETLSAAATNSDCCQDHKPDVRSTSFEPQARDEFDDAAEESNENKILHMTISECESSYLHPCVNTASKEASTVDSTSDSNDTQVTELENVTSEFCFEVNDSLTTTHEISKIYNKILIDNPCEQLKIHAPPCNESNLYIESYQTTEAQDCSLNSGSETNTWQETVCNVNDGSTNENIHHISFKDLKVTEAVKRWIREVTPEKAFTLSKEVQTRLLAEKDILRETDTFDEYIEDGISEENSITVMEPKNVKGNPFVAASSEAPIVGMEDCSKRVAVLNLRETTPDTLDEYDGASVISNLSYDHLYSEASSSHPASVNHSFDDEEMDRLTENPDIYNPTAYTKYYQLGVELDEIPIPPTSIDDQMSGFMLTAQAQDKSDTISECGSEEVETVSHKYDVTDHYTGTSPMSLATEIIKAEKVLKNMVHIVGVQQDLAVAEQHLGNPDIYLKHYSAASLEVGDSGVQSEESSDETEARSSSGVGSSLASTPAISPAHQLSGRPPLQPHPLKNLSVREGPVPCRTVCCAVM